MMTLLLAFLGVSAVIICTPGPDTALTVRNALVGGRRAGIATAAGVSAGQLTWTLATAAGLAAVLQTSQVLFGWLKLVGAAYLIFLGLRALVTAWRLPADPTGSLPRTVLLPTVALRQGLLSNLANPKMVPFFLSLLPQFVPPGVPPFWGFLALGTTFCLMTFGWLCLYAVVLDRARTVVQRRSVRRGLEGASGVILVALGVRLATESR
jgi:threonine/homoserine/homoserine lactone efflux protein